MESLEQTKCQSLEGAYSINISHNALFTTLYYYIVRRLQQRSTARDVCIETYDWYSKQETSLRKWGEMTLPCAVLYDVLVHSHDKKRNSNEGKHNTGSFPLHPGDQAQ